MDGCQHGQVSARNKLRLSKVMDILFGVVVMGTVGTLIGIIMGGGIMPLASGAGLVLGGVIGFMGGRRFLASILVGTAVGRGACLVHCRSGENIRGCGSRRRYGWISRCADFDVAGYARGKEEGCNRRSMRRDGK